MFILHINILILINNATSYRLFDPNINTQKKLRIQISNQNDVAILLLLQT